MNTRPAKIFLLGLTLSVGAVVGLAPAGEAKPVVVGPVDGPVVVAPPTTAKPPIDLCDIRLCDPPLEVFDPCDERPAPERCTPPTTTPPTTTPPTTTPPTTEPDPKPRPPKHPRPSTNPDVVVQTPRFTG